MLVESAARGTSAARTAGRLWGRVTVKGQVASQDLYACSFRVISQVLVFGCHRTARPAGTQAPATAPVLASSSLYIACEPVPDERDGW